MKTTCKHFMSKICVVRQLFSSIVLAILFPGIAMCAYWVNYEFAPVSKWVEFYSVELDDADHTSEYQMLYSTRQSE